MRYCKEYKWKSKELCQQSTCFDKQQSQACQETVPWERERERAYHFSGLLHSIGGMGLGRYRTGTESRRKLRSVWARFPSSWRQPHGLETRENKVCDEKKVWSSNSIVEFVEIISCHSERTIKTLSNRQNTPPRGCYHGNRGPTPKIRRQREGKMNLVKNKSVKE